MTSLEYQIQWLQWQLGYLCSSSSDRWNFDGINRSDNKVIYGYRQMNGCAMINKQYDKHTIDNKTKRHPSVHCDMFIEWWRQTPTSILDKFNIDLEALFNSWSLLPLRLIIWWFRHTFNAQTVLAQIIEPYSWRNSLKPMMIETFHGINKRINMLNMEHLEDSTRYLCCRC